MAPKYKTKEEIERLRKLSRIIIAISILLLTSSALLLLVLEKS